jgi:hypothetical protein
VEIRSHRSETAQVFVNPDGTRTFEESVRPRFARTGRGDWVDADATLVVNRDGSVSPKAGTFAMRFSGGGTAPLAQLARAGTSLTLWWPGPLPRPVLSGSTATYSEVLPGVDLRVTADVDSFAEVLVVKTRAAAADPAVRRVRFGLATQGLTVTSVPGGGMRASDAAGAVVFTSPAPLMWDSSQTPAAGIAPAGPGRQTVMPLALAGGELSVTPDPRVLDDPATVFPVYVDPSWTGGKINNGWTTVWSRSDLVNTSFWQNSTAMSNGATAGDAGSGRTCDSSDSNGNCTSTPYVVRSLFNMDLSAVHGTHILGATFTITQKWAWTCNNGGSNAKVWLTGLISPATTWNNQPSWDSTYTSTAPGNHRYDQNFGCSGSGPVEFDVYGAASLAIASGWPGVTLGLRAVDEGTTSQWKRFDDSTAKISVTYNSVPATPDTMTVDYKACGTGASKAYLSTIGASNPTLRARVSDPDAADHLNANFSWTTDAGTATATQVNVSNGATAQAQTNAATFTPGTTYSWRVSASDGIDTSPVGGPCEFTVDNVAPNAAPTVVSADGRYPSDGGTSGWHDGVGKTGTFTFGSNGVSDGGVNDVVSYLYGPTNPPATPVAASGMGGSATIGFTPNHPGLNDLYVRSVDRAGNLGPVTDYRFFVGSGTDPVGVWSLGEGTGTTAHDTGTGRHDATLHGGGSWTAGRLVGTNALHFNGTDADATTTVAVLNTSQSYTVAAWVKLPSAGGVCCYNVVGQDGSVNTAFFLRYDGNAHSWDFTVAASDVMYTGWVDVPGPAAKAGVWTHVAGVYDAGTKQAQLYVNGQLVATRSVPATFNATGPLAIGRGRWTGGNGSRWPGEIADVRAWDRVVSGTELSALADATLVGAWDLDDSAGTAAADGSGYGHTGTLTGSGVNFTLAGHNADDPGAAAFTGTGAIVTAGPVLRTDQSYTVAAWVRASTGQNVCCYNVLSQDATHDSAFFLRFDGHANIWDFTVVADDTSSNWVDVAGSGGQPGVWIHVAGVYDASTGQGRLYINGQLRGTAPVSRSLASAGSFNTGRGRWADTNNGQWTGDIDDVRAYQGVLPDSAIAALANS